MSKREKIRKQKSLKWKPKQKGIKNHKGEIDVKNNWFFKTIHKIHKLLLRLTKIKDRRHNLPISRVKQEYYYRYCSYEK